VQLLTAELFNQPLVRELFGPRDYSMGEAARILGVAIGKPELHYVQFPYDEARKALIGNGLSASYASATMEISRSFNEGKVPPEEKRSARNTTPTGLEQFADDVFRKAYAAAANH